MSQIYNTEPPTKGKVILHTSLGPLEIELFADQAPKACRNFLQLCLETYYDNTIFHRLVPSFVLQGGDPTGTGDGGDSVYGAPFKDEFHSRLRYNRRGLVGMANAGPDDNRSQFFITLDRADELDKHNTLFGRVAGNSIFNLLKANQFEIDPATDRPLEAIRLLRTEVLWNPFDDLLPRHDLVIPGRSSAGAAAAAAAAGTSAASSKGEGAQGGGSKKKRKKIPKKMNLLSFGDEAEADERESKKTRTSIPSFHDHLPSSSASTSTSTSTPASSSATPQPSKEEIVQRLKRELAAEKESAPGLLRPGTTTDEQYQDSLRSKIADMERRRQALATVTGEGEHADGSSEHSEEAQKAMRMQREREEEAARERERKRAEKSERKRRKKELKRAAKQQHSRVSKLRLRRVVPPSGLASGSTSQTGEYKKDERDEDDRVIRRPRKVTGQNHSEREVMERLKSFRSSLVKEISTSAKTDSEISSSNASSASSASDVDANLKDTLKYPELGEASAFIEAREAELSRDESGWMSHTLRFKTIQDPMAIEESDDMYTTFDPLKHGAELEDRSQERMRTVERRRSPAAHRDHEKSGNSRHYRRGSSSSSSSRSVWSSSGRRAER
mmetsp:Transcript_35957/g.90202  ORF Transcript_35957/g.90202 Transcript_35957/m.90202 type:complete len:614 (-) Transcript_35957:40-1881(-)